MNNIVAVPHEIDALEFRKFADMAASQRGREGSPWVLMYSAEEEPHTYFVPLRLNGAGAGADGEDDKAVQVLLVDTKDLNSRRPRVESVTITALSPNDPPPAPPAAASNGSDPSLTGVETLTAGDIATKYDSVFWTEAAVEKFVLPYYASASLWRAACVLRTLSYAWYKGVPLDAMLGTDGAKEDDLTVPYAVGHTPDSEWQTLTDPSASLHLLLQHSTAGKAYAVPLSHPGLEPPADWYCPRHDDGGRRTGRSG